jgi:hypothetical protein
MELKDIITVENVSSNKVEVQYIEYTDSIRRSTKTIELGTLENNTMTDVVNRITELCDLSAIQLNNKEGFSFDVRLSDGYRKVISKMLSASNYIATTSRFGMPDFAIVNEEVDYLIGDELDFINIKLIVDNSVGNKILLGRKSKLDQPGLIYLINDSNKENIHAAISELGWFPQHNFMTVNILS